MPGEQAPKTPRRAISAKLTPVKGGGTASVPEAAQPSADQIAMWESLEPDQKMAVREREAVRMFGDALTHHRGGELEEAARLYGRALILNPTSPTSITT